MSEFLTTITYLIDSLGTAPVWIAVGLLSVLLLLWLVYRVVKAAVRAGIKDAGLVVSQPHMVRPRKPQDPKYDFVYTEPRSEQ